MMHFVNAITGSASVSRNMCTTGSTSVSRSVGTTGSTSFGRSVGTTGSTSVGAGAPVVLVLPVAAGTIAGGAAGAVVGAAGGTAIGVVTATVIPGEEGREIAREAGITAGAVVGGITGGIVGNAICPGAGMVGGAVGGGFAGYHTGGYCAAVGHYLTSETIEMLEKVKTRKTSPTRERESSEESVPSRTIESSKAENVHRRSSSEPCICDDATISVLYVNIRSMNPNNDKMRQKIDQLSSLIFYNQPDVIAIVESWLNEKHSDKDIRDSLQLQGYKIVRRDRCSGQDPENSYRDETNAQYAKRRGGGILVAWKELNGLRADRIQFKENPAESTAEFERINKEIEDRLVHLPAWYTDKNADASYSGWCMVGDFNWGQNNRTDRERLEEILMLARGSADWVPMSSDRTHIGGLTLDRVIASHGFVASGYDKSSSLIDVTEPISDHAALIFRLNCGKDSRIGAECKARQC
ncbi:unnamed protein product [Didymodactylos carnosus]|uniref:Endonuclease/exonuclease/phosphatase domain-containing protein n=2 Tax=Didymodactylos carnosus TaxID=1234261 RepID=A0A815S8P3_9BILA|nr:unnamed protein product [Didymodactylos carnosus]CAF4352177.1 unnamed protein product [Didymodactylos carnosus]